MKELFCKKGVKWTNTYYEYDDYIILNCFKAETNESYDVLIDKEDFEKIKDISWGIKTRKLVNGENFLSVFGSKTILKLGITFLHQYILYEKIKNNEEYKEGKIVIDHINGDRLNNRKSNLRIVSQRDNIINKENDRYFYKKGKYHSRITVGEERVYLGGYETKEEAEIIFLKANIIIGTDKICYGIKEEIKEKNVTLSEEDYDNKYLKRLLAPKKKFISSKKDYLENMEIVHNLRLKKKTWDYIVEYLKENTDMPTVSLRTLQKYYKVFKNNIDNRIKKR